MNHSPSWAFQFFDELPSTQDVAIAAARNGTSGPLAIVAKRQTAGRGRAGRTWTAPDGNLNFSAMLRPKPAPLLAAAWSLLAGVAVYETVGGLLPASDRLMLKWPNDLLLGGAKLAGVLIDSSVAQDGTVDWVVIGVGVNVASAPRVEGRATSCLADAGAAVSPEMLAHRLMAEIDLWRGVPFTEVRRAWLARGHPIGTRLRVQTGGQVIEGAFAGLTEDGKLKLEGAGEAASGDVEIAGT
jgi:BirA family transcriptional regulator, biotin operon repressor / biotin---[acetyl-CoA-carboxylase] ligase